MTAGWSLMNNFEQILLGYIYHGGQLLARHQAMFARRHLFWRQKSGRDELKLCWS